MNIQWVWIVIHMYLGTYLCSYVKACLSLGLWMYIIKRQTDRQTFKDGQTCIRILMKRMQKKGIQIQIHAFIRTSMTDYKNMSMSMRITSTSTYPSWFSFNHLFNFDTVWHLAGWLGWLFRLGWVCWLVGLCWFDLELVLLLLLLLLVVLHTQGEISVCFCCRSLCSADAARSGFGSFYLFLPWLCLGWLDGGFVLMMLYVLLFILLRCGFKSATQGLLLQCRFNFVVVVVCCILAHNDFLVSFL